MLADELRSKLGVGLEPGNYYGNLCIRRMDGGPYQWCVPDQDKKEWSTIPDYVGDALVRMLAEEEAKGESDVSA
jgi:hypothetical protein